MLEIPLLNVPSQAFTITLNNLFYDFRFKATADTCSVSISINNVPKISNTIIVTGQLLLPYKYLEEDNGNFFLLTYKNDIPDYTQFGIFQNLIYIPRDELNDLRNS